MAITEIYANRTAYESALIDVSADDNLTSAIDLVDWHLIGIVMPAAWTAADITFEGSHDNSTFNTILNQFGTTYTLTVSTDQYIFLSVADTYSFPRYIKIGTSAGQAADRTLILVLAK